MLLKLQVSCYSSSTQYTLVKGQSVFVTAKTPNPKTSRTHQSNHANFLANSSESRNCISFELDFFFPHKATPSAFSIIKKYLFPKISTIKQSLA